jgi:electron transfer flavoprotein alpha subunit
MTASVEFLVFSDDPALRLDLLGRASQTAAKSGGTVSLLLLGPNPNDDFDVYAQAGADKIYKTDSSNLDKYFADTYTAAFISALEKIMPTVALVGGTKRGFEMAPAAAESLNAGYASWALDFDVDPTTKQVTANCMIYSGVGTSAYLFKQPITILVAAAGKFSAEAQPNRTAEVIELQLDAPSPVSEILEYKPKAEAGARLEDAVFVIDIGQGIKLKEDLGLVEELAAKLHGQLACTRPIASDRDWFPEWLGLSGAKVHPRLCITLGVSGAIQHVIGIRDSKVIASVNSDENAGIFMQSDYGIVADLYEFLPALIKRMEEREITPA